MLRFYTERHASRALGELDLHLAAARIRIHFASACPHAALFRMLPGRLAASGP